MTDQTIPIVGMASDGFEAVQRAIELKPDLVLLSVGLHKLNGVEAAKRISEAVPGVKQLRQARLPFSPIERIAGWFSIQKRGHGHLALECQMTKRQTFLQQLESGNFAR